MHTTSCKTGMTPICHTLVLHTNLGCCKPPMPCVCLKPNVTVHNLARLAPAGPTWLCPTCCTSPSSCSPTHISLGWKIAQQCLHIPLPTFIHPLLQRCSLLIVLLWPEHLNVHLVQLAQLMATEGVLREQATHPAHMVNRLQDRQAAEASIQQERAAPGSREPFA